MFPVSKCTPGGPQLVIVRPGAYDADKLNITDAIRAFMLINDIMFTENDNLAVAGVISIVDLKDATLAHLMQMTPSLIKKMTMLNQEGTPMRQKGVHYFNTPPGFEKVFNMFNSFMNEKMRKRVSPSLFNRVDVVGPLTVNFLLNIGDNINFLFPGICPRK